MVQFDKIKSLQINDRIWVFDNEQKIEFQFDDDGVLMMATLHIDHEEKIKLSPPSIIYDIEKEE